MAMITYQDTSFTGDTIDLDNRAFRQCVFESCSLRFSAAGPTELSGCSFSNSQLVPEGAARLTLDYLRAFQQGLGEWGRTTVDQIFATIRRPDPTAGTGPIGPDQASSSLAGPIFGAADLLMATDRSALEAFGATPEGQAIVRGFERLSPDQRRQIAALICRAAGGTP